MIDPQPEIIPPAVLGGLQSSGFPFQTAVAHVIGATPGWSVSESEYPWRARDGEEHFLDLVATNGTIFLSVECKKTRKETFTFLRPLGVSNTGQTEDFRCLSGDVIRDSTRRLEIFAGTHALHPKSVQSEFCIVSTSDSGRDQRLLERDASVLIRATEAFAREFRDRFQSGTERSSPYLFLPVVVTNAALYTSRYRPTEVSLETGEFAALPRETESASWTRFRKAFVSEGNRDLGDRSVFVVKATSFSDFLRAIKPTGNPSTAEPSVMLPRKGGF